MRLKSKSTPVRWLQVFGAIVIVSSCSIHSFACQTLGPDNTADELDANQTGELLRYTNDDPVRTCLVTYE